MFGKNVPLKQVKSDGSKLRVQEIFYTVQGEGPWAGLTSVFIRLGGCNLACYFCDTDFDSNAWDVSIHDVLQAVRVLSTKREPHSGMKSLEEVQASKTYVPSMDAVSRSCRNVVLTGGEPLRQNVLPLIELLNADGYAVQIETAGTLWLPGLEKLFCAGAKALNANKLVVSPKTPKINEDITQHVDAYKFIIKAGEVDPHDGLPNKSTQSEGKDALLHRPKDWMLSSHPLKHIYVQPCDEQDAAKNQANLEEAARSALKYGYRLCVQIHKLAGLA